MSVTVKDISRLANVSAMTVSRVLNPRPDFPVAARTQQRVLDAARELGYSPNPVARALVTGRTHLIALWVSQLSSSFYASVVYEIQQLIKVDGYEMLIRETRFARENESDARRMNEMHVDGVLIYDSPTWVSAYLHSEVSASTPHISAGVAWEGSEQQVTIDLVPAARAAIEHLAGQGCRRIAFCTDAKSLTVPGETRHRIYNDFMRAQEQSPETIALSAETRQAARQEFPGYVRAHGCPDAIFCRNDEVAIGIHRGASDIGLSVPRDLALVGCDGIEEAAYHVPSLTTIRQPIEQACRAAWERLKARIDNPDVRLPPQRLEAAFAVGESSLWRS